MVIIGVILRFIGGGFIINVLVFIYFLLKTLFR